MPSDNTACLVYFIFFCRVLGTDMGGNMIIKGKEKKRTWSLLREPFANGQSTLKLIHDVNMMGWEVSLGVACFILSYGWGEALIILFCKLSC